MRLFSLHRHIGRRDMLHLAAYLQLNEGDLHVEDYVVVNLLLLGAAGRWLVCQVLFEVLESPSGHCQAGVFNLLVFLCKFLLSSEYLVLL